MEVKQVSYYKIIQPIKLTDGFEIKAGQKVMLVQEDSSTNMYNVQIEDHNSKRIFWVHSSNATLHSVKKERWPKSKVLKHDMDINEKWLENESRNTTPAQPAGASTKSKPSKRNSTPTKPGGRAVQKRTVTKTKSAAKPVAKKSERKATGKKTVKRTARKGIKKA